MPSIFSNIISNDLAHVVYSDDLCVAILDIRPANTGHCLVIPRVEVDQWTDLDSDLVKHLMAIAQKIGKAQKELFFSERIGLLIAGFEIAHCHLHVIPVDSMSDFEFGKSQADDETLRKIKTDLIKALETS